MDKIWICIWGSEREYYENKDQIDYIGRSRTCLEDYVNKKGISVLAHKRLIVICVIESWIF